MEENLQKWRDIPFQKKKPYLKMQTLYTAERMRRTKIRKNFPEQEKLKAELAVIQEAIIEVKKQIKYYVEEL